MPIKYLTVACFCLLITCPVLSDIYHWKDANGATHFSDKKPKNQHYERLQKKPILVEPSTIPDTSSPKKTETAQNPEKEVGVTGIDIDGCANLIIELETIKRTEPVFEDHRGRFHRHRSAFSRLYQGRRKYVEDDLRQSLIDKFDSKFSSQCKPDETQEKEIRQAIWEIKKYQNCELAKLYYKDRTRPKFRTAQSDLRELKKAIDGYCADSDVKQYEEKKLDDFDPANLYRSHSGS